MSTTMHVEYMSMKARNVSYQRLLDRCTSVGNGMGFCLLIAHVYLDKEEGLLTK